MNSVRIKIHWVFFNAVLAGVATLWSRWAWCPHRSDAGTENDSVNEARHKQLFVSTNPTDHIFCADTKLLLVSVNDFSAIFFFRYEKGMFDAITYLKNNNIFLPYL